MNHDMSEEYLMILNAISEVAIIAYTDARGRITYANKNFCEISGYTLEELRFKDHRILNSGHHDKEFFKAMYETTKAGKIWRAEIRNKKKDGSYYWVDSQIFPILNADKEITGYASIRFDITERKNMQDSLRKMEKLACLGQMAAVVAHEINNPLTVVDIVAQTFKNDIQKGDLDISRLESKMDKVGKAVKQITKIVRGLKTISRTHETEDFTAVNLKTFLEETLSFSMSKCRHEDIIFKLAQIPDIEFECKPDQISQILLNLVNNATDAISACEERWIELRAEVNESLNLLVLKVRDSGPGIAEEIADKILEPFFTTKEVGKGNGLGLSLSLTIAAEHKGKLYFERGAPNTVFVLEVPLRQTESEELRLRA